MTAVISWFDSNLINVLNGLAVGLLLFTIAVGLSLIFGLMDVLNLAHGALYLVGAYLAYLVVRGGGGFVWAALLAIVVGLVGGAALMGMTRPLAGRGHLDQALLTLGVAFILVEVVYLIFGNDVFSVAAPEALSGSVNVASSSYPAYRLALIGFGAVIAVAVYVAFERTRLGALVRAAVVDRDMVAALGVDVRKVLLGVFAAGSALAVLGGVLGAPLFGAHPGLDHEMLILTLVVVVVGGLGSVRGALVGALLIGQVQALGAAFVPEIAGFLVFAVMALVLTFRPAGLLGDATRSHS
ncbi:branched-chain amino acid ABC transporter permease [Pseudonocardia kunmingensis]|uniref:Amino acid/amide ABC transporter membrane protein 1 (HAAT family) n=1 Tax=Pseudonocardia kunmingensis TaxID=630975 RepID=A0A543CX04_9PSEU|nr:branched-chain amino acid ABC transporter permease [Pseudonocardia kunmingensis]TQM01632.1 amino acid/amide ABC transporter membrane protein 1 (HAAT family) [Pseudonocardia kunmingensis]